MDHPDCPELSRLTRHFALPEPDEEYDPPREPAPVPFDQEHYPSPGPEAEPDTDPWYPLGPNLTDTLTALPTTGVPPRGDGQFGPLPATARRTAFLPEAAPWIP